MGQVFRDALHENWWFYAFSAIAIGMLIASWCVPPMGQIDNSALKGVAEIFAFAALGTVIMAIGKGMDARVTHGDTSVTLGQLDKCPQESESCRRADDEYTGQ